MDNITDRLAHKDAAQLEWCHLWFHQRWNRFEVKYIRDYRLQCLFFLKRYFLRWKQAEIPAHSNDSNSSNVIKTWIVNIRPSVWFLYHCMESDSEQELKPNRIQVHRDRAQSLMLTCASKANNEPRIKPTLICMSLNKGGSRVCGGKLGENLTKKN